jgi:valyl-tRNA synthetase
MGYSSDLPENQGGKTIMNAPWPLPLNDDEKDQFALAENAPKATTLVFAKNLQNTSEKWIWY